MFMHISHLYNNKYNKNLTVSSKLKRNIISAPFLIPGTKFGHASCIASLMQDE